MIRPTLPADTPGLAEIAAGTGVFNPEEVETLRDVLDDYHGGARARPPRRHLRAGRRGDRLRLLRTEGDDRPHLVPVVDRRAQDDAGAASAVSCCATRRRRRGGRAAG
jgi:hypothetical protein